MFKELYVIQDEHYQFHVIIHDFRDDFWISYI